jgi:hypothetical protein
VNSAVFAFRSARGSHVFVASGGASGIVHARSRRREKRVTDYHGDSTGAWKNFWTLDGFICIAAVEGRGWMRQKAPGAHSAYLYGGVDRCPLNRGRRSVHPSRI